LSIDGGAPVDQCGALVLSLTRGFPLHGRWRPVPAAHPDGSPRHQADPVDAGALGDVDYLGDLPEFEVRFAPHERDVVGMVPEQADQPLRRAAISMGS